jgi:hypothetical protein
MLQGIARGIGAFLFSNTGAKTKTYHYITYDYYTSYLQQDEMEFQGLHW